MSIKAMIINTIEEYLLLKAPHLKSSPCSFARISSAKKIDEQVFSYNIKLIASALSDEQTSPEIPVIYSKLNIPVGAVVAVLNANNGFKPVILSEVII